MKTIGLIGGMSWESTMTYYQIINTVIKEELGGLHSARCVLYSVDFDEIEACQTRGDWQRSAGILADAARRLERAGADFFLICTNTMHKVAPAVRRAVTIPLLHIAEVTADELLRQGIRRVGLLGTRYTMEQDFYKSALTERGLEVLVPQEMDQEMVHRVIYDELCCGIRAEQSRREYREVAARLADRGAQGIILGCTEIGLLLGQEDASVPLFDTAYLHARRGALESIGK
jgi:aspartate racemase